VSVSRRSIRRLRAGREGVVDALELGLESREDGSFRLDSPPDDGDGSDGGDGGDDLAGSVAQTLRACAAAPAAEFGALTVEAGRVRHRRDGQTLQDQPYLIAMVNGVVAVLDRSGALPARLLAEPAGPPPEHLPVVLGASAVLSLVHYLLDATPRLADCAPLAAGPLRVTDSARSPYPPQHCPWRRDGGIAADRPLIPACGGSGADGRSDGGTDGGFTLFTRCERWLSPLVTMYDLERRNLTIGCAARSDWPEAALVIDSLAALSAPGPGRSRWRAAWSVRRSPETWWRGRPPLVFETDPADLLRSATGAVGEPLAACDRDAIEGERFGWAPELATGLALADLGVGRRP
jgi:hypothetical protein